MSRDDRGPARLALITTTNIEYLQWLAERLARPDMRTFWEDRMRVDPVATFASLFANPDQSIAFDIGPGDGVLAFTKAGGVAYRAYLFAASWGRRAMRNHSLRRDAVKAAMLGLQFEVLDGITTVSNFSARRAMEAGGMRYRGRIPKGLCYNGEHTDGVWYELSRADLGLPPL